MMQQIGDLSSILKDKIDQSQESFQSLENDIQQIKDKKQKQLREHGSNKANN